MIFLHLGYPLVHHLELGQELVFLLLEELRMLLLQLLYLSLMLSSEIFYLLDEISFLLLEGSCVTRL